jgi:hypothetical protein
MANDTSMQRPPNATSRAGAAMNAASMAALELTARAIVEARQRLWRLVQDLGSAVHGEKAAVGADDAAFEDLQSRIRDAGADLHRASRRLRDLGGRIAQREPLTIAVAGLSRVETRFLWLASGPAHVTFVPDAVTMP